MKKELTKKELTKIGGGSPGSATMLANLIRRSISELVNSYISNRDIEKFNQAKEFVIASAKLISKLEDINLTEQDIRKIVDEMIAAKCRMRGISL